MDHNSAIENHTAERYLMGELNEAERDAYEEHFFSCAVCADEIKSASEFMEGARQVVQAELTSQIYRHAVLGATWGSWLNWRSMLQPLPAAACFLVVAFAGFGGYQNRVTIPQLTQMAAVHVIPHDAVRMTLTAARGNTDDEKNKAPSDKPLYLTLAIPPDAPAVSFTSYQLDIVTDSGIKYSRNISKDEAQDPIDLSLAAGALQPGKYFVVIRGVNSAGTESGVKGETARFSFDIVK
ncbi:MAG TPA: zf-HC2 domain-containing protein [Candidatus Angelobacter sp.]|nr:zf-HC2 domain-containing protein [Candidatus Angelobacter sp.]